MLSESELIALEVARLLPFRIACGLFMLSVAYACLRFGSSLPCNFDVWHLPTDIDVEAPLARCLKCGELVAFNGKHWRRVTIRPLEGTP